MTESVRLRDPESLIALAQQIQLFGVAGVFVLVEAEAELAETEQWIEERLRYWEREVVAREEALDACLSDEDADCSYEAAVVIDAKAELENVERWRSRVSETGHQYRANAPRFRGVVEDRCQMAREQLLHRAEVAGRYVEDSGVGARVASARSVPAASVAGAAAANPRAPALQRYQAHGGSFADVPVAQIEEPQFAPGELHQADFLDMRRSFDRLPEIRHAIAQGTIDQLVARDPGARRVFDWFYGGDAIRVEWRQGQFTITGGKHRVYMARQLGLATLPASVWTP